MQRQSLVVSLASLTYEKVIKTYFAFIDHLSVDIHKFLSLCCDHYNWNTVLRKKAKIVGSCSQNASQIMTTSTWHQSHYGFRCA